MAATLPSDEGALRHDLPRRVGQRVHFGVERLFALSLSAEHPLKSLLQPLLLVVGQLHAFAEAPIALQILLHHLPGELLAQFLVQLFHVCAVGFHTHALVAQHVRVQLVRATSQHDAARFVVGGHDDERFVRVLFIKFVSHADGIVHVDHLVEHRGGIVAVARPVNFPAFHHEEEAVLLLA